MAGNKSLLADFVGTEIVVFTTQRATIQTAEGELAEINYSVDGLFIDYDDEFLLLERSDGPSLVSRTKIVDIGFKKDELPVDAPPVSEMN